MRSATLKNTLFLLIMTPVFLFAAYPDNSGAAAPTPLSATLGTYSFTQTLIDLMNASLGGYKVLTTSTIFLTLSGNGAAEGDVSVLAFNNKSYTFTGTYKYAENEGTFVFSKLSGKKISVVERIFGKGAFDGITSFFTGADSPLTYANGEIKDSSGTVFFTKKAN